MYNRKKAVDYAQKWWNGRNPDYFNFDDFGGDCTNFTSQCLHYGGIEMNYDVYGWFYNSSYKRSPAWTGVKEFWDFASKNSERGVRLSLCDKSELELGDIIQLGYGNDFHHSAIVTKIEYVFGRKNIFVSAHTLDCFNKNLLEYDFSDYKFCKILN